MIATVQASRFFFQPVLSMGGMTMIIVMTRRLGGWLCCSWW